MLGPVGAVVRNREPRQKSDVFGLPISGDIFLCGWWGGSSLVSGIHSLITLLVRTCNYSVSNTAHSNTQTTLAILVAKQLI